MGKAWVYI